MGREPEREHNTGKHVPPTEIFKDFLFSNSSHGKPSPFFVSSVILKKVYLMYLKYGLDLKKIWPPLECSYVPIVCRDGFFRGLKHENLSVVVHICYPSIWEVEEDQEFQVTLGYTVSLRLA